MKLTSTNRPFGLTIKFTRRMATPGRCRAKIGAFQGAQRAANLPHVDLDGDPKPCNTQLLFSCESSPAVATFFHKIAQVDPKVRDKRISLPVILPRGKYPFPSRTRKSSPAGPIVLHAKVCGRVGRRRHK